jgi:hypothetical protein
MVKNEFPGRGEGPGPITLQDGRPPRATSCECDATSARNQCLHGKEES